MKHFLILALLAAATLGLSSCASTSSTAGGDPVPGEKVGGEDRLAPGTTGPTSPSASVKW